MESGIYLIRNKVNNKVYIGLSKHVARRKNKHFSLLRRGEHHSPILQNAYNKYGEESFSFELLEKVPNEKLCEREIYWVSFYDALNPEKGYNYLEPGNVGTSGKGKIYEWLNVSTLEEKKCTVFDMSLLLGGGISILHSLTDPNGKAVSYKGWILKSSLVRYNNRKRLPNKIYKLKNFQTKEIISGTLSDLSRRTGYSHCCLNSVVLGRFHRAGDWILPEYNPPHLKKARKPK